MEWNGAYDSDKEETIGRLEGEVVRLNRELDAKTENIEHLTSEVQRLKDDLGRFEGYAVKMYQMQKELTTLEEINENFCKMF